MRKLWGLTLLGALCAVPGSAVAQIGGDGGTGDGGASVLLAETLGSSAGNLCVGEHERCVGVEINANHLVAVREGEVTGTAHPLHVGRRTQVWEIRIEDALGRLACISRLTLAVIRAG